VTIRLAEAIRAFPRVMIAQVHGYCLGGALGIMNCHDLVFAAEDAQLGMPEILRGSFGQLVTSTLVHGRIPLKKVALIQLVGRNLSGTEADHLGIVSQAVPAAELERTVNGIAREIASRHLATLEHAKIAVQMDRDLSLSQAIQLDMLVGARMQSAMDPTAVPISIPEGRPQLATSARMSDPAEQNARPDAAHRPATARKA
jgi:enoyl-CoA hydratase/carnithine racemase